MRELSTLVDEDRQLDIRTKKLVWWSGEELYQMNHPVIVREDNLRTKRDGERIYCLTLIDFPLHPGCILYFPYIRCGTLDRSVETEGQIPGYVNTCVEVTGDFRMEHGTQHALLKLPRLTEEQRRSLQEIEHGSATQLFADPKEVSGLFIGTKLVLFHLLICFAEHPTLLKKLTPTSQLLVERCTPFLDPGYVIPFAEKICPTR